MSLAPAGLAQQRACALVGLSRSRYYELLRPRQNATAPAEETPLRARLEALCLEFPGYGYRRVTAQLHREGFRVNHKRVLRLMREERLLCAARRSFVATTRSSHGFRRYPNLLRDGPREQALTGINQVWVADVTYLRLREAFLYLAVILDSYSRRIIGWELADTLEARLCLVALQRALQERQPPPGFIHHSDQGVQYASAAYVALLEAAGARISMARVGNPYDNAQVESFIRTLKREEVQLTEYRDQAHARQRLRVFLEEVYNQKRLHSALGYVPPAEFEARIRLET